MKRARKIIGAATAAKRRKADRLSCDRLSALPSAILLHCLVPYLQFEELMTHVRHVNKGLSALAESAALVWMGDHFGAALLLYDERDGESEEDEDEDEEDDGDHRTRSGAVFSFSSSSSSPSAPIAASSTPPTSFSVADAVYVNAELARWSSKARCNRGLRVLDGERGLLRISAKDVSGSYLLSRALLKELYDDGGQLHYTVIKGNSLACGFWLADVLFLVFQQYGHASALLSLLEERRREKAEAREALLTTRRANKNRVALKKAIEAEGVKWSWNDWEWKENKGQWRTRGLTLLWSPRGRGRWKVKTSWQRNRAVNPGWYALALTVHAACDKLGFVCFDCAECGHYCHVRHMQVVAAAAAAAALNGAAAGADDGQRRG